LRAGARFSAQIAVFATDRMLGGGEGGPNLIRSQLVLDDHDGELITTVVQNGRPDKGMPKFDLPTQDIATIGSFYSQHAGGRPCCNYRQRRIRWWATPRPAKPTSMDQENVPLAIPCLETWRG